MRTNPLQGKVALVTGASSGLGRAFAGALAKAGAAVLLVARREEKLREAVSEIAAQGGEAAYHVADVRSAPALYDLVDVLLARYRMLHILVNNAGLGWRAPLPELTRDQIAEMIETNLAAPIHLTQAALPALVKNAPSDIVNIASIAGLQGFPEGSVYCAVKHGVVGFTRALAEELKPAGVRVTAICSGSVDTAFFDRFTPTLERPRMLHTEDAVRALLYVVTAPPRVIHGEIVLRPRVV
jgi:short-subunit dehydrogenase